jgi:hypothetical protein
MAARQSMKTTTSTPDIATQNICSSQIINVRHERSNECSMKPANERPGTNERGFADTLTPTRRTPSSSQHHVLNASCAYPSQLRLQLSRAGKALYRGRDGDWTASEDRELIVEYWKGGPVSSMVIGKHKRRDAAKDRLRQVRSAIAPRSLLEDPRTLKAHNPNVHAMFLEMFAYPDTAMYVADMAAAQVRKQAREVEEEQQQQPEQQQDTMNKENTDKGALVHMLMRVSCVIPHRIAMRKEA